MRALIWILKIKTTLLVVIFVIEIFLGTFRMLDTNQDQKSTHEGKFIIMLILCLEVRNNNGILDSPTFIFTIIIVNVVVIFLGVWLILYAWKRIKELSRTMKTETNTLIRIKKFKYSDHVNKFKHSECVICLESFIKNCRITKIEACDHIFHSKWLEELNKAKINKLFRSKCPLCKALI